MSFAFAFARQMDPWRGRPCRSWSLPNSFNPDLDEKLELLLPPPGPPGKRPRIPGRLVAAAGVTAALEAPVAAAAAGTDASPAARPAPAGAGVTAASEAPVAAAAEGTDASPGPAPAARLQPPADAVACLKQRLQQLRENKVSCTLLHHPVFSPRVPPS